MKWYVVHTYSGYEEKIKAGLLAKIKALGKENLFGDILVPQADVVEIVNGVKKKSKQKFFPGYILIQLEPTEEAFHIVKSTPMVTGFVGGGKDIKSIPSVPEEEIEKLKREIQERAVKPKPKFSFEPGESVRVIDGPFASFNGIVEEVKADKGRLRVLVSIFGRSTPVEVNFNQVEKN